MQSVRQFVDPELGSRSCRHADYHLSLARPILQQLFPFHLSLSHIFDPAIMADQFLGFDLSTQQLKGEPHYSYPTTLR